MTDRKSKRVVCLALGLAAMLMAACAGGESEEIIEIPVTLPSAAAPQLTNPPGAGPSAGPASYSFWSRDRRANAATGLAGYGQIQADRLAFTTHFVLYREQASAAYMNNSQAASLLTYLETKLSALQAAYGDGVFPDLQKTGRIVVLALDIKDDYSTTGNDFVSGYFAPRDLFSNEYTSALYTNTALIQSVSAATLAERAGRSNMLPMVYADLKPFYNGDAFSGDTTKAQNFFRDMLLHEISHLMTYYRRVISGGGSNLAQWLAEGIAENAPMLVANNFTAMQNRLEELSDPLMQSYLAQPVTLPQFSQANTEKPGYLRSNLFVNYLRHRLGGNAASALRQLVANSSTDISALGSATQVFGMNLDQLFYDYALSYYVSAGGYNITQFKDNTGTPVAVGDGSAGTLSRKFSFIDAGIGKYGAGGTSFVASLGKAPIAAAKVPAQCLPYD